MTTAYISDDILFWGILIKLPAKSLVRFKSVSTQWSLLLSDSKFVKTHLQISKNVHNNSSSSSYQDFIIYEKGVYDTITLLRIPTDDKFNCSEPILEAKTMIPYPLRKNERIGSIAHCDGILCMFTQYGSFVVWNPLTKVQKVFKIDYKCRSDCETFGFGYDPTIDDYKIVYATGNKSSGGCLRIQVLRLKTGLWTDIDRTKCLQLDFGYLHGCKVGIHVNGCLYWASRFGSNVRGIVSFDLGKETIKYEQSLSSDFFKSPAVGILRGSLCFLKLEWNFKIRIWSDIWLFTKQNNDVVPKCNFSSKLFTIPSDFSRNDWHGFRPPMPLCFSPSNDHHQVLANIFASSKLVLNNAKDDSVKLSGAGICVEFQVIPFTGSLVSP